ncbi:lactoylglutathione lyase, glyoxalase [Mizugakiibacter sediminis]|uniref:Glyoxalase n=1 Tax=Mizugakiibacter sediminis TaxID=1475481 RepID=A0A0K8QQT6_9GAMM|nr:ArsI/CadI family heavy metal resistance metalloenzyme [Mizugakiibacter sediminis]GAP67268.1 lactoylglutathione lyase, glyoxalase [Mizugakiibacter sediminis]
MKRFHVHVNVRDLEASIRFYAQLFGAAPSVVRPDYAKWMLDDPRLNFAISQRERAPGIDHLGLQAEDARELQAIGDRLKAADAVALAETGTTCCYARSDKYWAEDPQGLRWESFHTHGEAGTYYAPQDAHPAEADACCGPGAACATQAPTTPAGGAASACCGGGCA